MVHNTSRSDTITIQFFVNCKTKLGQNVYICGNCSQLGNWVPHAGVKLETNRKNYPQWNTLHPIIFRSDKLVQFKVCIIKGPCVTWENIPQNHILLTSTKPLQVMVNFNCMFMQVYEKKVIQIECRNGIDNIMNDMESQWGSSIGHPSNYPIQRYHMFKRDDSSFNKSQVSSNLISITDSEEIDFEMKILTHFNPGSLVKTMSRPSQIQLSKLCKKNDDLARKMKIIPEKSQGCHSSPIQRSYRSLPKDFTKNLKNTAEEQAFSRRNSFPRNQTSFQNQEKQVNHLPNSQTLYSQRKVSSEKETKKASWVSKKSAQNQENQDLEEDMDDLFGFEIF